MRVFAYERVSTDNQDLATQRRVLTKYAEAKGFEIVEFFDDIAGYPYKNRPAFDAMMARLRETRVPVEGVLVFRIDRLGRNARETSLTIEWLTQNRGLALTSVHESIDTSTPIGRAMLEIILVLAQLEREQISEATRQRLKAKQDAGETLGRPRASMYTVRKIRKLNRDGLSKRAIRRETGYGMSLISRVLGPTVPKKGGLAAASETGSKRTPY